MPFGLTNAQSTFQVLMNHIFQPHLRKFVLVFFDDILICSHSWHQHLHHLEQVFKLMQHHSLVAKLSKCTFAAQQVSYLGHSITPQGVSTDPTKIQATLDWPLPSTIKHLRGFLGLTGYCRRFIKGYGQICQPLT